MAALDRTLSPNWSQKSTYDDMLDAVLVAAFESARASTLSDSEVLKKRTAALDRLAVLMDVGRDIIVPAFRKVASEALRLPQKVQRD